MIPGNASATSPKDTFIQGLQSSSNIPAGQAGSPWTLPSGNTTTANTSDTSVPTPTPASTPVDPQAKYKSAMDTYIASLSPSADVTTAKSKYLDFENNLQSGIAGQEGQGRGIPLQIVRGEQAKLQTQGNLTANRLQQDITLAQDSQTATQNQNKARADYEKGLFTDQQTQAKPFEVGGSTYQFNPTTGKNEIVGNTANAQKANQAISVAAQKFAVANNITKPVYSTGGKFYDSGTQQQVDLPTFQRLTGQTVGAPESATDFTKNVDTIGQAGSSKLLTPTEAKALGVPYGTTEGQAAKLGITPTTKTTLKTPKTPKVPASQVHSQIDEALDAVRGNDKKVSANDWNRLADKFVADKNGTYSDFYSKHKIFIGNDSGYKGAP